MSLHQLFNERVKFGDYCSINAVPLMFEKDTHDLIENKDRKVMIGDGTIIGNRVTIMGGFHGTTVIGRNVKIWDGSVIGHDCKIGDNVAMVTNVTLNGGVEVGEWTHIASGVVVKPKVKIGKFCLIGVGAVVVKDIPDYSVAYGNPAKVVKENIWRPIGIPKQMVKGEQDD